jgi:DNA-binding transcriptional LysR family regulator
MVSLRALQALTAVRTRGSVAAAAAKLGYTPSAISQQLSRLESETKTILLEPYGRSVRLTAAGEQLAAAADRILHEWEAAEAGLERLRGTVCGTVRVAAFPTVARGLLPDVLAALRHDQPDLELSLSEAPSHRTLEMLKDGDCDVAVAHDWPETPLALPPGIDAELLGTDVADIVLSAGHRCAGQGRIALKDLAGERWTAEPGSVAHDLLVHVLGREVNALHVQFAVREFPTQLALIASGLAIGLVPRMGRAQLPGGVLAIPTDPPLARRIYAAIRSVSAPSPSIQAVLAALRSQWARTEAAWPGGRGECRLTVKRF